MATFFSVSVGATAVRLAATGTWRKAIVSVETANVRYRVDGGLPDINTGHMLYATGTMHLTSGEEIAQCYLIASTATAGIVSVTLE